MIILLVIKKQMQKIVQKMTNPLDYIKYNVKNQD